MKLSELKDRKILILGFGREGRSTYAFLRKHFPDKTIAVADQQRLSDDKEFTEQYGQNTKFYFGKDYLSALKEYDVIFKSPGIPHAKIESKKYEGKITSQTELFLKINRERTVGVTGTKGKSTTSSLIHHILKTSGEESILLGNIGKPCLDYLDEDTGNIWYVFEMSSFQLQGIKISPHIAVFLNFFREHQDKHASVKEYFKAKSNITKFQTDMDHFIYNCDQEILIELAGNTKANTYSYSLSKHNSYAYVEDGKMVIGAGGEMCTTDTTNTLPAGEHNVYNKLAAAVAASILGVDEDDIQVAVRSFKPLKHRMEVIKGSGDTLFVNDSLATIPEASIAAIKAFADRSKVLIIGGKDRGQQFSNLVDEFETDNTLNAVVLIGETAGRLEKEIRSSNFEGTVVNLGNADMDEIVKIAVKQLNKKGAVILSPAAASFDMFEDYKDRGEQFKKAVKKLG